MPAPGRTVAPPAPPQSDRGLDGSPVDFAPPSERLPPTGRKAYVAIALVSAAVMLYEIAITRILSVVLWYHFAFLAVSLAMLGLGVPGVWFALRGAGPRSLERALIASAIVTPLSIVALFQFGDRIPWRAELATVCIAAPMLALGSAVCILLLQARGRAFGLMYGADLLGATAGALVVVPLMHVLPTPAIVAGTALLPALALIAIGRARFGIPLFVAIAVLMGWQGALDLRYAKTYSERDVRPLYERWTPTARLTVFRDPFWAPDPNAAFGWGMGTRYVPRAVEQRWLELDGGAGTPITRLTGPPRALDHLFYDVTSLGYELRPARRVSVIGAGGGRDVLSALASGATEVDAIELNPHIVDLVSHRFGKFSGDPYHLPGVHPVIGEGRSFLTTTPRRYDFIQISLIDSWAATAAGASALSENYLYTVDAYRLYWNRLSPTGMISTSRWIRGSRMLEALRLSHMVRAALELEGIAEPENHVAIAQGDRVATVLASRAPFAGALFDSLKTVCARRGFILHWPEDTTRADSSRIVAMLGQGPKLFLGQGIDLSPPVDDRPFFFQNVTVFGAVDRTAVRSLSPNEQGVVVLRGLMVLVSALALVLFFLPFALRGALQRGPRFWRGSIFFALIGLGFMLVEIPVIQKMILYLGHPSHATTVVLASILLGAGLGSAASGRLPLTGFRVWAVALPAVLAGANLVFPHLFSATIGWPWLARAATAFAIAGVMGFLMGFALPLGMLRFGDFNKAWFWAVNGACGVMASVCSLALAMTFGFERVVWLGVALYVMAVVLLASATASARRPAKEPRAQEAPARPRSRTGAVKRRAHA